jgi:3-oxoacyl-[acyl-carrier protein] reductase
VGRLAGKVAIVTGSTRGIGRAIALHFAREGACVLVTGRNRESGEAVVREIGAAGGTARFAAADLACDADVRNVVAAALETWGRLTTLVNNAAATDLVGPGRGDAAIAEVAPTAFARVFEVGILGLYHCCRHAIPAMIEAGGGSIVNISAHAAAHGVPGFAAYSASKGAMEALTRSIAIDYASHGIRCNAIRAGFVQSGPWIDEQMDERAMARLRRNTLTRLGLPDDIAQAATYLASDESAIVTGCVLPVDSGIDAK